MKPAKTIFTLVCLLMILPVAGHSASVVYDNSSPIWYTDGVDAVGTDGADMAGMLVTVTFGNGTSEVGTWYKTADAINNPSPTPDIPGSGQADGTGWSLSVNIGSTYFNSSKFKPWIFEVDSSVSISKIFIDAGMGNTVFDVVEPALSNSSTSTANSQSGSPFAYHNMPGPLGSVATYSGLVALTGQAPVGDLYRFLSIDFGAALSDTSLAFSADTDTLVSELTPVPEPATLLLFGAGISGIAAVSRWRGRK